MRRTITIVLPLLSMAMIADGATLTPAQLRRQRTEMAQRERRIIFNNDGDDIAMLGKDGWNDTLVDRGRGLFPVSAEGLLAARTTPLLDSQVDTITYYSTWGMKLHHRDGPFGRLYRCPDTFSHGKSTKNYRKILEASGKDCLEIMIDAGRKHGIEVFYSNRMNDWHDSFNTGLLYDLRREHPEWSMATRDEGRKYSYPDVRSCWSTWDFEVPEIRRLTLEALRDQLQDVVRRLSKKDVPAKPGESGAKPG